MPDQPSPGELWRLLERIEKRLDRVLTTDVWTAERREIERRLSEGEQDRTRLRDTHVADIEALRAQREQDNKDRAQSRRWLIAAVILPVASMVLTVVLLFQAGGTA